jgi:hypothetical protein
MSASLAISVPVGAAAELPADDSALVGALLAGSLLDAVEPADDEPTAEPGVPVAEVDEPVDDVVAVSPLLQAATSAAPATTPAPIADRRVMARLREPQPPAQVHPAAAASVGSAVAAWSSVWVNGVPI